MRISDCADLTGTTVRTIRYYHQIGLLPVPEVRGGRRDYGLDHAARILRIRWLAEAGLALEGIAEVLDADPDEPDARSRTLRELDATAASLDERLAELAEQRERVSALRTMAEEGRGFSSLPPSLARFYERAAERAEDPEVLAVLEKDRRIAEMFAQRGLLRQPQAIGALIDRLDDADIDLVVEFCALYARIPHQDAVTAEESARHLRALIRDWAAQNPSLTADTIAVLPSWMTIGPGIRLLRSFMTLMADDARQARLLRAIVDDLLDHDPEGSTHD